MVRESHQSDSDSGRVLQFRPRPGARLGRNRGSGLLWHEEAGYSPVPDFTKYEHTNDIDDYRHRMIVNVIAFVYVGMLVLAEYGLPRVWRMLERSPQQRRTQAPRRSALPSRSISTVCRSGRTANNRFRPGTSCESTQHRNNNGKIAKAPRCAPHYLIEVTRGVCHDRNRISDRVVRNRDRFCDRASFASARPRFLDQPRRLSKSGGRVVLRRQRLPIDRSDRRDGQRLDRRRQGVCSVRGGDAEPGREDLDLSPARSLTALRIRAAAGHVTSH